MQKYLLKMLGELFDDALVDGCNWYAFRQRFLLLQSVSSTDWIKFIQLHK